MRAHAARLHGLHARHTLPGWMLGIPLCAGEHSGARPLLLKYRIPLCAALHRVELLIEG